MTQRRIYKLRLVFIHITGEGWEGAVSCQWQSASVNVMSRRVNTFLPLPITHAWWFLVFPLHISLFIYLQGCHMAGHLNNTDYSQRLPLFLLLVLHRNLFSPWSFLWYFTLTPTTISICVSTWIPNPIYLNHLCHLVPLKHLTVSLTSFPFCHIVIHLSTALGIK